MKPSLEQNRVYLGPIIEKNTGHNLPFLQGTQYPKYFAQDMVELIREAARDRGQFFLHKGAAKAVVFPDPERSARFTQECQIPHWQNSRTEVALHLFRLPDVDILSNETGKKRVESYSPYGTDSDDRPNYPTLGLTDCGEVVRGRRKTTKIAGAPSSLVHEAIVFSKDTPQVGKLEITSLKDLKANTGIAVNKLRLPIEVDHSGQPYVTRPKKEDLPKTIVVDPGIWVYYPALVLFDAVSALSALTNARVPLDRSIEYVFEANLPKDAIAKTYNYSISRRNAVHTASYFTRSFFGAMIDARSACQFIGALLPKNLIPELPKKTVKAAREYGMGFSIGTINLFPYNESNLRTAAKKALEKAVAVDRDGLAANQLSDPQTLPQALVDIFTDLVIQMQDHGRIHDYHQHLIDKMLFRPEKLHQVFEWNLLRLPKIRYD
jgi:hypothetical protein